MRHGTAHLPQGVDTEIAALIEGLRATGERLETLTGGEVDSVVDRDGRTFLLRHVQEQLRDNEAAQRSAILNALPAPVALLDPQGRIVAVNSAWLKAPVVNAFHGSADVVGSNYLDTCDKASAANVSGAREGAEGIRAVLAGTAKCPAFEYSCHTPEEERWVMMTVTPLAEDQLLGAVVMYQDITARKRHEVEMLRFGAAMDAVADAIYLVDRDTLQFLHVNDAACRMQGKTRAQLLELGPAKLLGVPPAELERTYDAIIAQGKDPAPVEVRRPRTEGQEGWVELRRHAIRSGDRWTIVTLVRDIAERKEADAKLRGLNRVYAVLSGINALIVRVSEQQELFDEACRIAVDAGGFRMAMIVLPQPEGVPLVPAASAGKGEALMGDIRAMLASPEASTTMLARAMKDGQAVVANDSQNDTRILLGARYKQAQVRSIAVLPLLVADAVKGAIALYSDELGFFDAAEMKLLTELASDIAFAVDHIGKQDLLQYLAYYDSLTGLANRSLFLERTAQSLGVAASGGYTPAVFLIDIEHFKDINDSLGRAAGDALLRQVAAWLTQHVGDVAQLARLDADHFGLVLPEAKTEGDVAKVLEDILTTLPTHPFQLNGAEYRISVKIGVAVFPGDGPDADILFRHAEAALKKAKSSGERYLFYAERMTAAVAGRLALENRLRQALVNEEFVLHYQPKVSLVNGAITGCEALIRWNDPRTGLVPPGQFIPLLEETGLIDEVGRWALRQALGDYRRWKAAGLPAPRIAVNISPLQLRQRGFVDQMREATESHAGAAGALELELTESLVMEDVAHSIASLQSIRALGVKVAIDDFGTGFSSLSYLARLPVDTLKIDRSFVVDMTAGPRGLALVSTIINLAHSLKLGVVAEGVETQEQSRLLRLLGCDQMQGYLFSKPVPAATYESLFLDRARVHPAAA